MFPINEDFFKQFSRTVLFCLQNEYKFHDTLYVVICLDFDHRAMQYYVLSLFEKTKTKSESCEFK